MKHAVGWAVALLTLFSLASCIEKDNFLGSALVPSDQDITVRTATLDLPVDLRMADSLQSAVSQSITVGSIRTRTFGLYRSEAAMTFSSANDSVQWGRDPSVRRIYLSLVRDTAMVINSSQRFAPQNLQVHYLTTQLDSTHRYNNSLGAGDYNPENLMTTLVPYMGEESYTVDLDKAFGERFFRIPMETLDSAELFMRELHGFYLTCDDPEEGLEGGRLNVFDLSSSSLILNYDYTDDDGNRKSATATFLLGQEFTVNVGSSGARGLETDDPSEAIYMEGLCGIKPHIRADRLREKVLQWASANGIPYENLLIAKATVEFPFEFNGDPDQFDSWSGNLFPCRRTRGDWATDFAPLDEISDASLETGSIDRSKLTYKSNISSYLQELLHKDAGSLTDEDDLWMMPTVSTSNSYTGATYYFPDYYFYRQDFLNGTAAERHPVLKLTYSVLN